MAASLRFCYSLLDCETDTHPKRIKSDWATFCAEVLNCPEPRGSWPLYEYLAQAHARDKTTHAQSAIPGQDRNYPGRDSRA
jgi:hypothetical protein